MKRIWITSLEGPEQAGGTVQALMTAMKMYGLESGGHFWSDDLEKLAWLGPLETLAEKDTAVWVILGSAKSLEPATVRYGLGLLAISVLAKKGQGFPIIILDSGEGLDASGLPLPLRGAEIYPAALPTLGAKLVARANLPLKPFDPGYRLNIHASEHLGVWFEVGPAGGQAWNGALVGVNGGNIDFHGAGPAGTLPQKAVLEYPMQGLKLDLGGKEYIAWAVQNTLDAGASYYVRVRDIPASVVFGPLEGDDGVYTLDF